MQNHNQWLLQIRKQNQRLNVIILFFQLQGRKEKQLASESFLFGCIFYFLFSADCSPGQSSTSTGCSRAGSASMNTHVRTVVVANPIGAGSSGNTRRASPTVSSGNSGKTMRISFRIFPAASSGSVSIISLTKCECFDSKTGMNSWIANQIFAMITKPGLTFVLFDVRNIDTHWKFANGIKIFSGGLFLLSNLKFHPNEWQ